jgi:hypothetical protein
MNNNSTPTVITFIFCSLLYNVQAERTWCGWHWNRRTGELKNKLRKINVITVGVLLLFIKQPYSIPHLVTPTWLMFVYSPEKGRSVNSFDVCAQSWKGPFCGLAGCSHNLMNQHVLFYVNVYFVFLVWHDVITFYLHLYLSFSSSSLVSNCNCRQILALNSFTSSFRLPFWRGLPVNWYEYDVAWVYFKQLNISWNSATHIIVTYHKPVQGLPKWWSEYSSAKRSQGTHV